MTTLNERATNTTAARVDNAVKTYGEGGAAINALDGITAGFARGAFTSIMGPSGSGKSTLLHCLAGLDELSSGDVHIGDVDLGSLNDRELTMLRRERVGFVFQAFNLIPTLTAEENILLPLSIAGRKPDRDWFNTVISTIGIGDRLTHRPSELSGGQQQRVAAARAMMSQPDIIFADEPSGNLDSTSGAELLSFMRRAVAEMGQTIIMVTHDPVAASFSDRIVFLADGKAVDDMVEPTPDSVLDRMKKLGS
jgi:putative ABC transport system ATP-binding protein